MLELDDISANIVALKPFLISEIYDLRQELNQPIKSLNKQEDYTELKTQLRYIQRENQSLKEENENKRRRIERVLSQNNKLLKLNYKIYNKYNVTHYREKSVKECPKRNDFQTASKTATTKIKQSLEKDMCNRNTSNLFISPNRFGRLLYEDNNNDDNESVRNNIDSTKTLQNDQRNKESFARKYNNNDKWLLTNIRKIKRFIHVKVLFLEQILKVKHWLTLKQTVPTLKFSLIALQVRYTK